MLAMPLGECVRCGYCCKQSACQFGRWSGTQCEYLLGEKPGEYSCSEFEIIQHKPGSHINPAFGRGCCSSLNSDRRKLVRG
jgi:hypothetical protein